LILGDKIEITLEGRTVQLKKLGEPPRQRLKIKFDKKTGLPHFRRPQGRPRHHRRMGQAEVVGFSMTRLLDIDRTPIWLLSPGIMLTVVLPPWMAE
jgi:hypothetical protein